MLIGRPATTTSEPGDNGTQRCSEQHECRPGNRSTFDCPGPHEEGGVELVRQVPFPIERSHFNAREKHESGRKERPLCKASTGEDKRRKSSSDNPRCTRIVKQVLHRACISSMSARPLAQSTIIEITSVARGGRGKGPAMTLGSAFGTIGTILAIGILFSLLLRTGRPRVMFAGLVLVSLASYLRPGPGGNTITAFSAWSLSLFWTCIALERIRPRHRYALFSEESKKSMALMPFRAAAVVAAGSAIVVPWRRGIFPSLGWSEDGVPLALQIAAATLLADFAVYWIHRAQHASSFYWRFHMPHHATRELSAVANHRTHIVELALVQITSRVVIFNVLGISATAAIASNVIAYTIAGTVSHANLDFPDRRWRWLNYLVVTPNVHAIHHGLDRKPSNFSETFPIWDLLFGTFVAPNEKTMRFGIDDESFTEKGVFEQHLHGFGGRGRRRAGLDANAHDSGDGRTTHARRIIETESRGSAIVRHTTPPRSREHVERAR